MKVLQTIQSLCVSCLSVISAQYSLCPLPCPHTEAICGTHGLVHSVLFHVASTWKGVLGFSLGQVRPNTAEAKAAGGDPGILERPASHTAELTTELCEE